MSRSTSRRHLAAALAIIVFSTGCGTGDDEPTAESTAPEPTAPAPPTAATTPTATSDAPARTATATVTASTKPPDESSDVTTTVTPNATPTVTAAVTRPSTIPPVTGPSPIYDVRPASDLDAPPLPDGWSTVSLGTSVLDRDITALARTVKAPDHTVLVIGGIHGNEPASPPTVRSFVEARYGDDVSVWLVPALNPDGVADGTRWNANGVDLNRNFSWDWRASDGGPGPLSEPESAAVVDFIRTTLPDLVIWVHQPYGYVGSVGPTAREFESAWSAGSGLPTRSGVTQHGGGETWTAFDAEVPAMLIEIDTWAATPEIVATQLNGFQSLLAHLGWDS